MAEGEQARLLKRGERLTHRRAAHAQLLGQQLLRDGEGVGPDPLAGAEQPADGAEVAQRSAEIDAVTIDQVVGYVPFVDRQSHLVSAHHRDAARAEPVVERLADRYKKPLHAHRFDRTDVGAIPAGDGGTHRDHQRWPCLVTH